MLRGRREHAGRDGDASLPLDDRGGGGEDAEAAILRNLKLQRLLEKDVAKAIDLLRQAVDRIGAENAALAQAEIERMLERPIPVKHQIRELESDEVRKLLGRAFSLQREQRLDVALSRTDVNWSAPLRASARVGEGLDERAVELPLALAVLTRAAPTRVLDAGASLNVPAARTRLQEAGINVVHVTQSGEKEEAHFDGSRVSYLFGDLRDLPFRDDSFDVVACVSTLEHIGMDNTRYGGPLEDDRSSYLDAVSELRRVLRPGGSLFLSFPVGRARTLGWFQVLGAQEVSAVLERLASDEPTIRYFSYEGSWVESDARRAEDIDDEDKEIVKSVAVVTAVKTGAPDGPQGARTRADERDRRPT